MQTLVDVTSLGEVTETAPQAPAAPAVPAGTAAAPGVAGAPTVNWSESLKQWIPQMLLFAGIGTVVGYTVRKVW